MDPLPFGVVYNDVVAIPEDEIWRAGALVNAADETEATSGFDVTLLASVDC